MLKKLLLVIILITMAIILAPELKRLWQRGIKFKRLLFLSIFLLGVAIYSGQLIYHLLKGTSIYPEMLLLALPLLIIFGAAGVIIWKQRI